MKVIFLDRDGVINKDPTGGYVTCWEKFHFLPGSIEAIKKLTDNGYDIMIISNQAGIAKGLFSPEDLKDVTQRMLKIIEEAGGKIKSINYCMHYDEDNCLCRKPKPGLLHKAVKGLNINFADTYFIGDGTMDMEAGKAAGCKTILLLSGKTRLEDRDKWKVKPDHIVADLQEAVNWVLNEDSTCLRLGGDGA